MLNKMKSFIFIFVLLAIIIQPGCTPDLFWLNRQQPNQVPGLIMSGLESVEKTADNALVLHDSSRAALALPMITQLEGDFTVELKKGDGVRFAIRSASANYEIHPAIKFDFTVNGCIIKENNELKGNADTVKAIYNEPSRIIIQNDGKIVRIKVDCDIVYYAKTELPATEYIIVETLPGSEAYLYGINFADVLEGYEEGIYDIE